MRCVTSVQVVNRREGVREQGEKSMEMQRHQHAYLHLSPVTSTHIWYWCHRPVAPCETPTVRSQFLFIGFSRRFAAGVVHPGEGQTGGAAQAEPLRQAREAQAPRVAAGVPPHQQLPTALVVRHRDTQDAAGADRHHTGRGVLHQRMLKTSQKREREENMSLIRACLMEPKGNTSVNPSTLSTPMAS
jgi:hypothetical protein